MRKAFLTAMLIFGLSGMAAGSVETVTLPEPDSPFVAFRIWVQAGSQNDPSGREGLADVTATLLAEGSTTLLSYDQILDALYPMATGYSVSVDKEMTVFSGTTHRDNVSRFYELLRDAVLKPAFSPEDFRRVKERQLNWVRQMRKYSSDEELAKELLFHCIYRGTPYAHPEEGYTESIERITLDDVKTFYRTHYLKGNIVVGLGGSYSPELLQQIEKDFAKLPEGKTEPPRAPEPRKIEGVNVLIVEKPTKATAISIGYPIDLLRSDNDFYPMMLVNSWLGQHRNSSSHLYQVIRETRGMNYGDYTYIEAFPNGHQTTLPRVNVARRSQLFQIWIRPISLLKPGDMHDRALFATRAALRELNKLLKNGLSEEAFEITRGFLMNWTANLGSTLSRRLGYRLDDRFYRIEGSGHLAGIRPALEKMTLSEANSALRRTLQDQDFWMVLITEDAESLKEKLVAGTPTPITYASEKPDSVLDEDREIASFKIPIRAEKVHIVNIDEVLDRALE